MPVLRYMVALLFILLVWCIPTRGQDDSLRSEARAAEPIERFLNPDGTLNLSSGFSGSLDPDGWRLRLDEEGAPRFEPSLPPPADSPGMELGRWDDRFGPPGANGVVYAIAVMGDSVYVGGRFNAIGGITAFNVAMWDRGNRSWHPLAEGVNGPVRALLAHQGRIYVGGTFSRAGSHAANGVAMWTPDTTGWSMLGGGLMNLFIESVSRGGDVYTLAAVGNTIYAGGVFQVSGNPGVRNFARWDGNQWSAVTSQRLTGVIFTLLADGTNLYVGGSFTRSNPQLLNLARLNTVNNSWSPIGAGVDDTVRALAKRGNDLYVGGVFLHAGGIAVNRIARWTGTEWKGVGNGVDAAVYTILPHGENDLYVGGLFTSTSGLPVNCIARWNGGSWSLLSSGMGLSVNGATQWRAWDYASSRLDNGDPSPIDLPFVWSLAMAGDELFAGGHFTSAGNITTHHIASWSGVAWETLTRNPVFSTNRNGADGPVHALAVDGDRLYIGGDFTSVGGVRANRVARWNSATHSWEALGDGIGGASAFVRALAFKDGMLYVGGIFDSAGGFAARGLARWNGTAWSSVGGGVGGDNPFVFTLAVSGDHLYAGGAFTSAGGIEANGIARWDIRSGFWAPLAEGVDNDTRSAYVAAIVAKGNEIYAGGGFSRAGGGRARNIARWDGTRWHPLGEGIDGGVDAPVRTIATGANGDIYAGGEFRSAGGKSALYLARWSGTEWSGFSGQPNAPVDALLFHGSALYIGGEFTMAGNDTASHLARWNGTAWERIQGARADGVNGFVRALAPAGADFYTAGEFATAGGIYARNVARISSVGASGLGSDTRNGLYGIVTAVAVHGGDVYVGGAFTVAGGLRTGSLARWDGEEWLPVGPDLNGPVRALVVDQNGNLYVGGEFTMAGDLRVNGIARWDGSRWSALGTGMGGGWPYVYALAINGGSLYAGGAFISAGGIRTSRIARWDLASGQWGAMAGGVNGAPHHTYVSSIATFGSDIYVGGVFPGVGAITSENVARWDGSRWHGLGQGVNNSVYALAVDDGGELFVGGDIRAAGDVEGFNLARWTGDRWGFLPGLTRPVYALATRGEEIFVGGGYRFDPDFVTSFIVRWSGDYWKPFGSGAFNDFSDGMITTMLFAGGDLYIGGDFSLAGGIPSYHFAIWHPSLPASVEEKPVIARPGESAITLSNHPNPCFDRTTITFTLPRPGHTTLTIFDGSGREVEQLAEGYFEGGTHTVGWEPRNLPGGVYLCRVQSGGATYTARMILLGD